MPLQWRNQIWQNLEEGAGKRCSECGNRFSLFFSLFLPGVDASHVYVGVWALGCFRSYISTKIFRKGADRVGGQLRGSKECPPVA